MLYNYVNFKLVFLYRAIGLVVMQILEEYVIVRMDSSLMAMILNVSNHFGHFGSFLELSLQLLLFFVVVGVHVVVFLAFGGFC